MKKFALLLATIFLAALWILLLPGEWSLYQQVKEDKALFRNGAKVTATIVEKSTRENHHFITYEFVLSREGSLLPYRATRGVGEAFWNGTKEGDLLAVFYSPLNPKYSDIFAMVTERVGHFTRKTLFLHLFLIVLLPLLLLLYGWKNVLSKSD